MKVVQININSVNLEKDTITNIASFVNECFKVNGFYTETNFTSEPDKVSNTLKLAFEEKYNFVINVDNYEENN